MNLYFAPLEGLTDAIYRRVHHEVFGCTGKYFMPFVSPAKSLSFTGRVQFDLSPAQNAGVPVVPQVLCRDAPLFLEMARLLRDAGYKEVNLNLGCPSGTVTAKGKGAGMLRDLDALAEFLDQVYVCPPLPVSLKTRAGFDSPEEWPALLDLILRYPAHEWILHPRTCREFYEGEPHRDFYAQALERASFPVIYNGDLFTAGEARDFLRAFPDTPGLMLGRGLAANPALAREIMGGEKLSVEDIRRFHDRLYREYLKYWPESAVVGRMHGIMHYLIQCLDCPVPARRALRKAVSVQEYEDAAARVFDSAALKDGPRFIPPHMEGAASL